MSWPTLKRISDATQNFGWWEVECRCGCGLFGMNHDTLARIQTVRYQVHRSITLTRGVSCVQHNKDEGGIETSSHLLIPEQGIEATALDILAITDQERGQLMQHLPEFFPRIWIYARHIHVDRDSNKPWPRLGIGQYRKS